MATQNVLCTHRPFAIAVKRIDLATQDPIWIVRGEPYWKNQTNQRINVTLVGGEPVLELDWTNKDAGEFPVTVTLKIPLKNCCKSIRAQHHMMKASWMEKEDAILKFWEKDLKTVLPHQTEERYVYNGMTLSMGGVDLEKATWVGVKEKLVKEDRVFFDILLKEPRDIEILTCWSRDPEGMSSLMQVGERAGRPCMLFDSKLALQRRHRHPFACISYRHPVSSCF